MYRALTAAVRRWWHQQRGVQELPAVRWWVPVWTPGNAALGATGTLGWQDRGAARMIRLPAHDQPFTTGSTASGTTLRLLTLAPVPVGARVRIAERDWRVVGIRQRGAGQVRVLACVPESR